MLRGRTVRADWTPVIVAVEAVETAREMSKQ